MFSSFSDSSLSCSFFFSFCFKLSSSFLPFLLSFLHFLLSFSFFPFFTWLILLWFVCLFVCFSSFLLSFFHRSDLLRDEDSVSFWVPGHVGIRVNSAADAAAEDAFDGDISNKLIHFSDLKPLYKQIYHGTLAPRVGLMP